AEQPRPNESKKNIVGKMFHSTSFPSTAEIYCEGSISCSAAVLTRAKSGPGTRPMTIVSAVITMIGRKGAATANFVVSRTNGAMPSGSDLQIASFQAYIMAIRVQLPAAKLMPTIVKTAGVPIIRPACTSPSFAQQPERGGT